MSTATRTSSHFNRPYGSQMAIHHDPQAAANALALAEESRRREEAQEHARQRYFYAAGRVLIASLFVIGGLVKAFHFSQTREAMDSMGLAGTTMLLVSAVAIELVAGSLLAFGCWVRRTSAFLIAYLAALTLLIHGDLSAALNRSSALGNLAIAGGLLLLVAHGPGGLSLERVFERRAARQQSAP